MNRRYSSSAFLRSCLVASMPGSGFSSWPRAAVRPNDRKVTSDRNCNVLRNMGDASSLECGGYRRFLSFLFLFLFLFLCLQRLHSKEKKKESGGNRRTPKCYTSNSARTRSSNVSRRRTRRCVLPST